VGRRNRFGVESVASTVSRFELPSLVAFWYSPFNPFGVEAGLAKLKTPFWKMLFSALTFNWFEYVLSTVLCE
jgi:hypothetical protein